VSPAITQAQRRLDSPTRLATLLAPASLLGYGVFRLIDGTDGVYGPGLAWTIGHVLFLAAFVAFGVIVACVPRLFLETTRPRRLLTWLLAALGLAGVAAFARVIVIDLLVGFRADSHADMSRIDDEYATSPGDLSAGFYEITEELGPLLFQIGLIGLLALLAYTRPRAVPRWSPIVALLAFAPIIATLALLPLAAVLFFVALRPLGARPASSTAEPAVVNDKKENTIAP
jgi:hypothetical protein